METLRFEFPATRPLSGRLHAGVVASGDLEILVIPHDRADVSEIRVRTTASGYEELWRRVLTRALEGRGFAARYEIRDAGATPGMVALRLTQAHESAEES